MIVKKEFFILVESIVNEEELATKEFIEKWNSLSVLAKEERKTRREETGGIIIPSKLEFNDLIMNTLVKHDNKIDFLHSIKECLRFIQYEKEKILKVIKVQNVKNMQKITKNDINSNDCFIVVLFKLKHALKCKEFNTKYFLLMDVENLVKQTYRAYALYLPFEVQKDYSGELRKDFLNLFPIGL